MTMVKGHALTGWNRIDALLYAHGISQWGVARNEPPLPPAPRLPRAIALIAGFQADSLAGVKNGTGPPVRRESM